jgi:hypothetical protein
MIKFLIKLAIFIVIILSADRAIDHVLKKGLDTYYGMYIPAAVLCVGHSHTQLGIDSNMLQKGLQVPVAKYAIGGTDIFDRTIMLRNYLACQPNSVRIVVYDVDARMFGNSYNNDTRKYSLFFPYMDLPEISDYIWKSATYEELLSRKVLKSFRYSNDLRSAALQGLMKKDNAPVLTPVNLFDMRNEDLLQNKEYKIHVNNESLQSFKETVKLIRSRNIKLVLLYIPTAKIVNDLDRAKYESVISLLREYSEKDKGIVLLNYNEKYENRYDLFNDPTHVNAKGREMVTRQLVRDLMPLL